MRGPLDRKRPGAGHVVGDPARSRPGSRRASRCATAEGETWFVSFDANGLSGSGDGRDSRREPDLLGARLLAGREPSRPRSGPTSSSSPTDADGRAAVGHAPADEASDLEEVFRRSHRSPDGSYRAVAARAVPGRALGGFRYYGTRPDDPNDIVPHEHRRELRALKVFGAWTNLVDMKAGNTLDTLITENGKAVVRHYLQDVGSTFGTGAQRAARVRRGLGVPLRRRSHLEAARHASASTCSPGRR